MQELAFDVVLHLAGEQILPNYMAIRLCECPFHVVVATTNTQVQIDRLSRELGDRCEIRELVVPAFQYPAIMEALRGRRDRVQGRRVGFNITGGTKPMSAAALDFCRETDIVPFYVDTTTRKIHMFKAPFATLDMPPVFNSVEEFIRLAGYSIANRGLSPDDAALSSRADLSRTFWMHRDRVRRRIAEFAKAATFAQHGKPMPPAYSDAVEDLLAFSAADAPELGEKWKAAFPDYSGKDWKAAARYAAGAWFEEYCASLVRPLSAASGLDVRFGLRAGWEGQPPSRNFLDEAQDMDLAITDGYSLTVVECKAGALTQEHIQKLENTRAVLGGALGRAVLVSVNPPTTAAILKRVESSRGVAMVCCRACPELVTHLGALIPGQVLGADSAGRKPGWGSSWKRKHDGRGAAEERDRGGNSSGPVAG